MLVCPPESATVTPETCGPLTAPEIVQFDEQVTALMVSEYVTFCTVGGTLESVTSTMMLVVVPAAVGVPEIVPWFGLAELVNDRPAGSVADVPSRENV